MSEVVTAESLRAEILEAGHSLRAAMEASRDASVEYVRLKHDYQEAWDSAFLNAEGTEQTRKSVANLLTADADRAQDEALERKRAAKLEAESWQSIVSAYQSIAATAREEMRLAR